MPGKTDVYTVIYVGNDGNQRALAFSEPAQSKEFARLLVIDDNGSTGWQKAVPHRELSAGDEEFTSQGYGHTWHYAK